MHPRPLSERSIAAPAASATLRGSGYAGLLIALFLLALGAAHQVAAAVPTESLATIAADVLAPDGPAAAEQDVRVDHPPEEDVGPATATPRDALDEEPDGEADTPTEAKVPEPMPAPEPPALDTDVIAWRERVDSLLLGMAAGRLTTKDADALYWELDVELWPFYRQVRRTIEKGTTGFIEAQDALDVLYRQRNRLIPLLSTSLRRDIMGAGRVGRASLRNEISFLDSQLRAQLRTLRGGLKQIFVNLQDSPLATTWLTLQLLITIVLFRIWRSWSRTHLMQTHERLMAIRPRQLTYVRLGRLLWYLNRVGGPLAWLVLIIAISRIVNPRGFEELAELVYTVLIWIIVARLAVQLIDAIAARGVGGMGEERAALRLRSLRLFAAWAVLLGLGLDLVTHYSGEGAIHAWFVRGWELLTIPIAITLVNWWRDEVRERLEEIADQSERARSLSQPRKGLASYLFTLIGALYLAWVGLLKWLVRRLSGREVGRRILAVLVRREVAKDIANERREDEQSVPEEIVTRLLEAREVQLDHVTQSKLESVSLMLSASHGGGFVILGEHGSGKSVFLRRLSAKLGDRMHTVGCPSGGYAAFEARLAAQLEVDPGADLHEALPAAIEAADIDIIGIDDSHRLARPWMGGQRGLDKLAELDGRLGGRVAWVLMTDAASWRYILLSRAERALLHQIIELPPWSEEEIAALVAARARIIGVEPDYRDLVLPRQLDAGEHENMNERNRFGYARILWELADGNPEVALQLFARSLRARPGGRVAPRLPQPIFSYALSEAKIDTLLVLRVILQCDVASLEDISKSLRISESRAMAIVRFCHQNDWIEAVEGGWRLKWKYFRAITRVLVRQNLVPR